MRFIKGMLLGGAATIGAILMYNEMSNKSKKQVMKKSRQLIKKMGIL